MNYSNSETLQMTVKRKEKKSPKRVVPRMTYNVSKVEEYAMYAATTKTQEVTFALAVDGIKHGVAENKSEADMLSLYGADRNNTVLALPKSEWKKVLKRAIKFYSGTHQYEKCIDCQQLINTIQ